MKAAGLLALWALVSVPVAVALAVVMRASRVTVADQVEEYLQWLGTSSLRWRLRRAARVGVVVAVAAAAVATSVRLVSDVPERILTAGVRNRDRLGPQPAQDEGEVALSAPGETPAPPRDADQRDDRVAGDESVTVETGDAQPTRPDIDLSGLRAPRAEITTAEPGDGRARQAGAPSAEDPGDEAATADREADEEPSERDADAGADEVREPRRDGPADDDAEASVEDDPEPADDPGTGSEQTADPEPETPPAEPVEQPEPTSTPEPAQPRDVDGDGVADTDDPDDDGDGLLDDEDGDDDGDGTLDADDPDHDSAATAASVGSATEGDGPGPPPADGGHGHGHGRGGRGNGPPPHAAAPPHGSAADR